MIKKFIRAFVTVVGAALGYGVARLLLYIIDRYGVDVDKAFTSNEQLACALAFAVIFGIIFFRLSPLLAVQTGRTAKSIESDLAGVSGNAILSGTIGLIAGLIIALLMTQVFSFIENRYIYAAISVFMYALFGYLGIVVATSKGKEIVAGAVSARNRSQESSGKRGRKNKGEVPKILDTSVIIDGRISDIINSGFLEGPIVIPEFVLVELRHIADSPDSLKRVRGRRGLDILKKIQEEQGVEIYNTDGEKALKEIPEVDVKLLKLAQIMNGKVVTNDYNLNKVAGINDVGVLNINKLANCLKPVVIPGEEMELDLIKEGKDKSQAIGYLDDGTMIVVEDGKKKIGTKAKINVTSVLQTSAGRMIFGRLKK